MNELINLIFTVFTIFVLIFLSLSLLYTGNIELAMLSIGIQLVHLQTLINNND